MTCIILRPYGYEDNMLVGIMLLIPTAIDHFALEKDDKGIGNSIRFLNGIFMGIGWVLIIRSILAWI